MDMQRARELLSILADGIDPFTGEILPDQRYPCGSGKYAYALKDQRGTGDDRIRYGD